MIHWAAIAVSAALGGVGGWALEAIVRSGPPRYAKTFGDAPVPWLPVYGVGTALVVAAAPWLRPLPWIARGIVYAIGLTAVEATAGTIDRRLAGPPSWDYHGQTVDVPHAAGWGLLALGIERLAA